MSLKVQVHIAQDREIKLGKAKNEGRIEPNLE